MAAYPLSPMMSTDQKVPLHGRGLRPSGASFPLGALRHRPVRPAGAAHGRLPVARPMSPGRWMSIAQALIVTPVGMSLAQE